MTDRRSLSVVVLGIGGSVLARSGRPDQVLWDAGKGDIATALARQPHRRPPSAAHGAWDGERPPAIGLDLDDVHEAGAPIPVAVALRQLDADRTDRPVWARLAVPGSAPVDVQLGWDDTRSSFVGELPGQAPGLYGVRVWVREVPGAGDLDVSDTVAVVEGD